MPPSPLLNRARDLRLNQTHSETLLWNQLRAHRLGGWKWKRQVPRGRFVLDFCCAERALVVELDGPHHTDQAAYDARRTHFLESVGLKVVRFDSNLVLHDLEGLCAEILALCGGPRGG